MKFFSQFFGDKTLSNIDSKVDELINAIPKQNDSFDNSEDTTGKIVNSFLDETSDEDIGKLFQDIAVPTQRLARYNTYDEVNRAVPIIRRIIKVFIANILPKNPVTGKCIIYRDNPDAPSDKEKTVDKAKKFVQECVDQYEIVEKLRQVILPRRLLYGDCFVEVVDVEKEKEKVDLNQSTQNVLTESIRVYNELENNNVTASSIDTYISKCANLMVEFDQSIPSPDVDKFTSTAKDAMTEANETPSTGSEDNEQPEKVPDKTDKEIEDGKTSDPTFNLYDTLIKIHKPHNIIILDTRYGTRIGYIEVLQQQKSVSTDMSQALTQMVSKVTNSAKKSDVSQDMLVNKLIFHVLKKIVSKAQEGKSSGSAPDVENLVKAMGDDVHDFIKRMFIEQGIYKKDGTITPLKVRFISPARMTHFSTTSIDYAPFGESVVESLILPCKLYMLAQLANAITKLSRASLIRKWRVDVGSTQMHSQLIQRLKRELYNTRVTLNDLSSFKSIPKILSDFKDMFILTKQGTAPVDVEVQSMGDSSIKVQDLEDSRREIIALSGVPAPYLGYMDTVELREQLVHTNVAFATEIIEHQEGDIKSLNELMDIIAEVKGYQWKPSEYVSVSLIPPVVLILQLIEMTLSSVGNISGVFQNMGMKVDPYYFLEQYVPHIDWDAFKEKAAGKTLEDKTKKDMIGAGQDGGVY